MMLFKLVHSLQTCVKDSLVLYFLLALGFALLLHMVLDFGKRA